MWCPPAWNRDVQQEYLEKHIGGAVRFDMTEFTDKTSPTPLMILPQQQFEEKVGKVRNHKKSRIHNTNQSLHFKS